MLTMPFTVAVYMVRGFMGGSGDGAGEAGAATAADEAQIGRLTGLLAAVYSFAQFTTSYAWGIFSSRFGRKVREEGGGEGTTHMTHTTRAIWALPTPVELTSGVDGCLYCMHCHSCCKLRECTSVGSCRSAVALLLNTFPLTLSYVRYPTLPSVLPPFSFSSLPPLHTHTHTLHPLQPVMVLGSAASSVTLLWFGLSDSFSAAVVCRVVAGLFNGIIVAWKCSIGESCDILEQGRVRQPLVV